MPNNSFCNISCYVCFLCCYTSGIYAQFNNLVHNSSFEDVLAANKPNTVADVEFLEVWEDDKVIEDSICYMHSPDLYSNTSNQHFNLVESIPAPITTSHFVSANTGKNFIGMHSAELVQQKFFKDEKLIKGMSYEISIEFPSPNLTLKFITSYKILNSYIGVSYYGKNFYHTYATPIEQPFFRRFGINTGIFFRLVEFKRKMKLILQYNFQYSSKNNETLFQDAMYIDHLFWNSLFLLIKKDIFNKWNCFFGIGLYRYAQIAKHKEHKDNINYFPFFLIGTGYYFKNRN